MRRSKKVTCGEMRVQRQSTIRTRGTRVSGSSEIRSGFSLVEILVVIGIIVLLVSLTLPLVGQMNTTARTAATRATITKIHGLLQERREAFGRYVTRFSDSQIKIAHSLIPLNERSSSSSNPAEKIEYNKYLYKWAFAQTYAETRGEVVTPTLTSQRFETESAEMLYIMLTRSYNPLSRVSNQGAVFGVSPVGEDYFSPSEVKDTDGNGQLEFVDGWGRPLRYYRWPTRLIRPSGYTGSPYSFDELQPINQSLVNLLMPGLTSTLLPQDPDDPSIAFAKEFGATSPETNYHTLYTYHQPLIVSAGPDGFFGLYSPSETSNFGFLAQPIVSMVDVTNTAGEANPSYNVQFVDLKNPGASTLNDNITNYQQVEN